MRHATEAEYVSCMREILSPDISSESDVVDMCRCCSSRPSSSLYLLYLIRKVETGSGELDLEG